MIYVPTLVSEFEFHYTIVKRGEETIFENFENFFKYD